MSVPVLIRRWVVLACNPMACPIRVLQENGLTALPTTIFDDMTRVTHLELEGNAITMLQPGLFAATTAAAHM